MATVNEKMTALADEIRELSGTTTTKSIDTMTSDIDAANTKIAEQTDLIAQIKNVVDNLPEAGSGGNNVSEKCTVNFNFSYASGSNHIYYAQAIDSNGVYSYTYESTVSEGIVTINPLCNSIVFCDLSAYYSSCDLGIILCNNSGVSFVYQTPSTNSVATINFECD